VKHSSTQSQIWLERRTGRKPKVEARGEPALFKAQRWLEQGKLLTILGTGTVYLACAADNPSAIAELRKKVNQPEQPLPVLFPNSLAVGEYCLVDEAAIRILESAARPVVVLEQRQDSPLRKQASPFLKTIGVRLPRNHLESLLFQEAKKNRFTLGVPPKPPKAIVMASRTLIDGVAGLSQKDTLTKLEGIVAGFLMHGDAWEAQEAWETQMDDSVVRIFHPNSAGAKLDAPALDEKVVVYPVRLGRGYAPRKLGLPDHLPPALAGGL
jgi:hydrogenase maturation protein HypF